MKKYKNYLLFIPSLVTKDNVLSYKVGIENLKKTDYPIYQGKQTNECTAKFIMDYLHNEGQYLDKIVMLCTKEVLDLPLSQIDSLTTYNYLQQELTNYIKHGRYTEEMDIENLFQTIRYVPQNNENENQIIEKLMTILGHDEDPSRLFVDFTGGNRTSALTLIFACRILEKTGIEIGKILYSNLNHYNENKYGVIEECTRTYQIFSDFENNVLLKNDIVNDPKTEDNSETQNAVQKEMWKLQKELVDSDRLNQVEQLKKVVDKIHRLSSQIDTSSHMLKDQILILEKRGQELLEEREDILLFCKNHLERHDYGRALNIFREKIISSLYAHHMFDVNKRYKEGNAIKDQVVANEIVAAYYYYMQYMVFICHFIHKLCENIDQSPYEVREKNFRDYFDLSAYAENDKKISQKSFKHNYFSWQKSNSYIMPYIKKEFTKTQDLEKSIQFYFALDSIYMGQGFPFACTMLVSIIFMIMINCTYRILRRA